MVKRLNSYKIEQGFTLVELSIVIVIIGLIVAGVVGGQTLVKQAKLRSIVTDMNKIQTAVTTFRLEFNSLPGDFARATDYWGGATNNGNGDRIIDNVANSAGAGSSEIGRVFQHLSLASILEGNYTPANRLDLTPELSYPSKFNGAVIIVTNYVSPYRSFVNRNHIAGKKTHVVRFGGYNPRYGGGNTAVSAAILTINDAVSLDKKVDDGIARSGMFSGHNQYLGGGVPNSYNTVGCLEFGGSSTSGVDGAANYNLGADFTCNLSMDLTIN